MDGDGQGARESLGLPLVLPTIVGCLENHDLDLIIGHLAFLQFTFVVRWFVG